ncbi:MULTISPECIES: aldehyde dehydrogenase family protein [unclassified Modicisalibacter]|uniref:aldehyde dehydrogenase family protein n=1 Tax=unclassified Modicisalibacter TaxID=2679913 RepID=UPI001CCCF96B|nr:MULTISPECIES: aldehyde dehydrogenase family protein [unclassified Modicisalibacter]MBZ9558505.1 aldehyde dehydrogenase family protein [Modicisalibacter sp. R2A 31.J]MBZ9575603.1 aldehyde dehydrogenase family protein [Modicisalibacter sp. MOD 31.J]
MGDSHGNLIGGAWRQGKDVIENRNPSRPSELVGLYARGGREEAHEAVEAAKAAQPAWAAASPQVRADVLDRAGDRILARGDELARLLAREEGKPLAEARGEVTRAGHSFKFFAGEAVRLGGQKIPSTRPGCDVEITREPVGVVGLVTPWNFPIAIPAWKAAPALAAGNVVILKPAELTPGCAYEMARILHEAGCPAGVFNLVMGSGSQVGAALTEHPDVAAISFTGSEGVGRSIAVECAHRMKKVQLEMGGKNPMVVLDDADLEVAVQACLNGAFFSTGQRCTASSRLIVTAGIHDAFVERLDAARSALALGDPLDADTQLGPVASERQLSSNLAAVSRATQEGCDVKGGERLDRDGYFQVPALFLNASNRMSTARDEIFGPCASVIRVADFEEAVAVANDTPFGLSAGICTQSLKHATAFKRLAQAGMVMVNLPTAGVDYHVPFGGRKASSLGGREQGSIAMDFYTTVKTAYTFAGDF